VHIGLISDTHGLMRPEALDALRETALIIHSGDIGDAAVLEALGKIAPVRAIRGNNDRAAWALRLPVSDVVEVGARTIYVLHNLAEIDLDPAAAGFAVVVSGHSHRPLIERRDKILYVNPGSAGPRRFALPVTVGRLTLGTGHCTARIVRLAIPEGQTRVRADRRAKHKV